MFTSLVVVVSTRLGLGLVPAGVVPSVLVASLVLAELQCGVYGLLETFVSLEREHVGKPRVHAELKLDFEGHVGKNDPFSLKFLDHLLVPLDVPSHRAIVLVHFQKMHHGCLLRVFLHKHPPHVIFEAFHVGNLLFTEGEVLYRFLRTELQRCHLERVLCV